jgi:hypothetical protein
VTVVGGGGRLCHQTARPAIAIVAAAAKPIAAFDNLIAFIEPALPGRRRVRVP